MKSPPRAFRLTLLAGALILAGAVFPAQAQLNAISIDPGAPVAHWLAAGSSSELPVTPRAGLTDLPAGNIGWFDYGFMTDAPGWWQVNLTGTPHLGAVRLKIDHEQQDDLSADNSFGPGEWYWLGAGPHRLRVFATSWIGLPQVKSIRLNPPRPHQKGLFRLLEDGTGPAAAIGQCAPLRILAGGFREPFLLRIRISAKSGLIEEKNVEVPPSVEPSTRDVQVPCTVPGDFQASVTVLDPAVGRIEASRNYSVFPTSPVQADIAEGEVAVEVDMARQAPEFGNGETRVVTAAAGDYRESSDIGATRYVRSQSDVEPGWFAYRVTGLLPGQPYLFEVDYPDDAVRVTVAAFRDARETIYPTSFAMETGGVWPLSGGSARRSAIIWPQSQDARVIFYTMHDKQRAAVSKFRFRKIAIQTRETSLPSASRREVAIWSEEGKNFRALVGKGSSPVDLNEAADRYATLASLSGATMLIPTVAVYNSQLYPSRYNLTFQDRGVEDAAALILAAQRHGLRVMPELNMRADELLWPARDAAGLNRRLLLSSKGVTNRIGQKGAIQRPPHYNILDADVRDWYSASVVELAARYKDMPNFAGVQLRVMDWQNPALNNLVSLQWGYGARTVSEFFHETKLPVPDGLSLESDAPADVSARHDLLIGPLREKWISWRCERIAALLGNIVSKVRALRPDLEVRLGYFGLPPDTRPVTEVMREAGLDLSLLAQIDGLRVVDARFAHGAKEGWLPWQKRGRERYRNARDIEAFAPRDGRAFTLTKMEYLEITGRVAPSERLGWSAAKRRLWVSAASEPPGRHRLARYAELVAFHDVYSIGDGGNGYVFSGDGLREFAAEFSALPKAPFTLVKTETRDLTVRKNGRLFYVVNISDRRVDLGLQIKGAAQIKSLTSENILSRSERLDVSLPPYAMKAFSSDCDACEISVSRRN